jgi:hypothetical protein
MQGVSFSVAGRKHKFVFTTNALCAFEDVSGMSIAGIVDPSRAGVKLMRQLVWAGLIHEDISMDEAGDLIDAVGMVKISELVGKAMEKAFPEAEGKPQASQEAG